MILSVIIISKVSYRNRFLIETHAANPKARTLNTPEKEIGEMMRRVISHEIGHALGLPHNMKASSVYPVDSLRSGTFTHKNGNCNHNYGLCKI